MFPVHFRKPTPILERFVQFYAQREMRLRDPVFVQSVPARAAPMLEFVFGDPLHLRYPGSSVEVMSPRAVLVGVLTRPHCEIRLHGSFTSFVIMFQPAGLSALFPVALREWTDRSYDARSVAAKPIDELEERLADCDSFASRVRSTDAFLARRIPDHLNTDRLSFAMDVILARSGRVRVPELASYSGISKRQFDRMFATRFGMRPKLYARIIRFQSALDCKARSSKKSWTDVAHEYGYYDQMHMIHDFEEFTGETPTETLHLVETFFRQQIEAIRIGMGAKDPGQVPRFVI